MSKKKKDHEWALASLQIKQFIANIIVPPLQILKVCFFQSMCLPWEDSQDQAVLFLSAYM